MNTPELPRCGRLWHRGEAPVQLDPEELAYSPEEDTYDPRSPENVASAPAEDIAIERRQLLTRQIEQLDRALTTGAGSCSPVTAHYRQVRAELSKEVVGPPSIDIPDDDVDTDDVMDSTSSRPEDSTPEPFAYYCSERRLTEQVNYGGMRKGESIRLELQKVESMKVAQRRVLGPTTCLVLEDDIVPDLSWCQKADELETPRGTMIPSNYPHIGNVCLGDDSDDDIQHFHSCAESAPKTPTKKRRTSVAGPAAFFALESPTGQRRKSRSGTLYSFVDEDDLSLSPTVSGMRQRRAATLTAFPEVDIVTPAVRGRHRRAVTLHTGADRDSVSGRAGDASVWQDLPPDCAVCN